MGREEELRRAAARKERGNSAQQQQQRQHLAQHATLIERFGRPLIVGGMYTFSPNHAPVFQITDIAPVMDPKAQPGTFRITIASEVVMYALHRSPVEALMLISLPDAMLDDTKNPEGAPDGQEIDDTLAQGAADGTSGIVLTDVPLDEPPVEVPVEPPTDATSTPGLHLVPPSPAEPEGDLKS